MSALVVTVEERRVLEAWTRDRRARARADRARAVLLSADGRDVKAIAAKTRLGEQTVRKWIRRFARERLGGLEDQERTGAPPRVSAEDVERVVAHTLAKNGPNGAWTTRTLARAVGLSQSSISRIWRSFGIQPDATARPPFGDDVRDVLGVFADGASLAAVVVTGGQDEPTRAISIAPRLRDRKRAAAPESSELGEFLRSLESFESGAREVFLVTSRASQVAGQIGVLWSWLERAPRHRLHFVPDEAAARGMIDRWFARLTGAALGWAIDPRRMPVPSFARYLALQAPPNRNRPGSE